MAGTLVLNFDKDNKQIEYQHTARCKKTGNWIAGWIVIEQPWYSPESQWKYYIMYNKYGEGGFCGGATDLGLVSTEVDKDSIKPYNQISIIEQEIEELNVRLEEFPSKEGFLLIKVGEKIPYEIWDKEEI